jgi:hypothetical protein
MKRCLVCLCAITFAACRPPSAETDAAAATPSPRAAATPQASPPPKPGAWMWQKEDSALGLKQTDKSALEKKPAK